MAKTAKTKSATALAPKSAAAIALVPASGPDAVAPAKGRKLTPNRAAWIESYREKQRIKRVIERSKRDDEHRERDGYFRLQTRVNAKLKAFTGKPYVRTETEVKSFRLDMISLGKQLTEFGERLSAAGIAPEVGYSETCPRLLEALRDNDGVVKKLEKLRAELVVLSNLRAAFDLYFLEPKELANRAS